jgi:hypothetical protein
MPKQNTVQILKVEQVPESAAHRHREASSFIINAANDDPQNVELGE